MLFQLFKRPLTSSTFVLGLLFVLACSDAADDEDPTDRDPGTGGTVDESGGATTGGASSGGHLSTGGATGGAGTGGATGGSETGGATATGGAGTGGAGTGGDGTGGDDTSGGFSLTSTELVDMGMFADINTCAGNAGAMGFGEAIPLEWSDFPAETMSFALTMIDVTLVDEEDDFLGCHSAFWNVPVGTTSMPDTDWTAALSGAMSIRNGYLGPCPNFGGGMKEDTYVFTLYAMGDATLSDPAINTQAFSNIDDCNALRQALEDTALDVVTLTGTSNAVGGI